MEFGLPTPLPSPKESHTTDCCSKVDGEANLMLFASIAIIRAEIESHRAQKLLEVRRFQEWMGGGQRRRQCDPCHALKHKVS